MADVEDSSNEHLHSAIVRIECTPTSVNTLEPYKSGSVQRGVGTGCVVRADFAGADGAEELRLVLTCFHVIDGSRDSDIKVYVSALGRARAFPASIRGLLPAYDLALLVVRIDDAQIARSIRAIDIANSDDVQPGCRVAVCGFPLGVPRAKISTGEIAGTNGSLLQTTAPVNPGNSGGPAVCIDPNGPTGKLIGIVTSKINAAAASNIAFCVPSHTYITYATRMLATPGITAVPLFGICFQPRPPNAHGQAGVSIIHCNRRSTLASKLALGDVLSAISWTNPATGARARVEIANSGDVSGVPGVGAQNTIALEDALARIPLDAEAEFEVHAPHPYGRNGDDEIGAGAAPTPTRVVLGTRTVDISTGVHRMVYTPYEPWSCTRAFGMCFVPFQRNVLTQSRDFTMIQTLLGLSPGDREREWVVLSACAANCIAFEIGLRPGQLVRRVNGRTVRSVDAMRKALMEPMGSRMVSIEFRGGRRIDMEIDNAIAEERRLSESAYSPDPDVLRAWEELSPSKSAR